MNRTGLGRWTRPRRRLWLPLVALVALVALAAACGDDDNGGDTAATATGARLSGTIEVDGSSTVFPITQAMAEEFQIANRGVRVTVGISGTGGGFKRFCDGETAISDASRPISDKEKQACAEKGIEYIELFVAYDGLSVLANPKDTFVDCLTTSELKKIWDKGSTVANWKDVRAGFPDKKLVLFGPGTDSGTFDYFTEEINGKSKQSRADYTASEDDNVLVQGISQQEGALGYFGYAYYVENQGKLRLLGVDAEKGKGCVKPSKETIENGAYSPLARPIFIYASKAALKRPEVAEFVRFYLDDRNLKLVEEVGYIRGDVTKYDVARSALGAALR